MSLLNQLFAQQEFTERPYSYSAEVMCANWVAQALEQPAACVRTAALEKLREADTPTFLARIYACQRC